MAANKTLAVTGYIIRDGKKIRRDALTQAEQSRLAARWNSAAMEAAGYAPMPQRQEKQIVSRSGHATVC